MTGFTLLLGSLDARASPFVVDHPVGFTHETMHLGNGGGCNKCGRVEKRRRVCARLVGLCVMTRRSTGGSDGLCGLAVLNREG